MEGHLEVWSASGRTLLPLTADRCTVGSSTDSDLVVEDPSVSRTHVLFEQLGGAWFVEDLGSRNGTYLNGQRITGRRVVRPGDEIRLGVARIVLRGVVSGGGTGDVVGGRAPGSHSDVSVMSWSRCAALFVSGDPFTEPASIREIAAELFVSDAAVKQHLANLFDKFGIVEGDRRRLRLANAALSSGAVSLGDLQPEGDVTEVTPTLLHGRYEVMAVVGRGGEGTLVRAVDRRHGRDVALKLRRVPADPRDAERLLVESRTLLSLAPASGPAAGPG